MYKLIPFSDLAPPIEDFRTEKLLEKYTHLKKSKDDEEQTDVVKFMYQDRLDGFETALRILGYEVVKVEVVKGS